LEAAAGVARLAEFEVIARDPDMHGHRPFRLCAVPVPADEQQIQLRQAEGENHRERDGRQRSREGAANKPAASLADPRRELCRVSRRQAMGMNG
jgi:hypothetical protein